MVTGTELRFDAEGVQGRVHATLGKGNFHRASSSCAISAFPDSHSASAVLFPNVSRSFWLKRRFPLEPPAAALCPRPVDAGRQLATCGLRPRRRKGLQRASAVRTAPFWPRRKARRLPCRSSGTPPTLSLSGGLAASGWPSPLEPPPCAPFGRKGRRGTCRLRPTSA